MSILPNNESEVTSKKTVVSVWFSMTLVALVSIIIGFAAGYSVGFNNGTRIFDEPDNPQVEVVVNDDGVVEETLE